MATHFSMTCTVFMLNTPLLPLHLPLPLLLLLRRHCQSGCGSAWKPAAAIPRRATATRPPTCPRSTPWWCLVAARPTASLPSCSFWTCRRERGLIVSMPLIPMCRRIKPRLVLVSVMRAPWSSITARIMLPFRVVVACWSTTKTTLMTCGC